MVEEPGNKMHVENIHIFMIEWRIVKTKDAKETN
jgi:hypothetical protein